MQMWIWMWMRCTALMYVGGLMWTVNKRVETWRVKPNFISRVLARVRVCGLAFSLEGRRPFSAPELLCFPTATV